MGQKRYFQKMRSYIKDRDRLVIQHTENIDDVIMRIANDVIRQVRLVDFDVWNLSALNKLMNEIALTIDQEVNMLFNEVKFGMDDLRNHAIDNFDEIGGSELKIKMPISRVNPEITRGQNAFVGSLIKGFVEEQKTKANTIVNLGVRGGKSPFEVAKQLQKEFKMSIGRGLRIARTEMLRVHSMTQFNRQDQIFKINPGLRRAWKHSHATANPRGEHLAAEERYSAQPIKQTEQYVVMGEALWYPRDLAGSAKNTIHCGCYEIMVLPDLK